MVAMIDFPNYTEFHDKKWHSATYFKWITAFLARRSTGCHDGNCLKPDMDG